MKFRTLANARYAVVYHSEAGKPTGRGYVVRSMVNGQILDHANYEGVPIVSVHPHKATAAKKAESLNNLQCVS